MEIFLELLTGTLATPGFKLFKNSIHYKVVVFIPFVDSVPFQRVGRIRGLKMWVFKSVCT